MAVPPVSDGLHSPKTLPTATDGAGGPPLKLLRDSGQPPLADLPALFEALYTLAADQKVLVVIDEFPYLLPSREKERDQVLTAVQAVMEERDASQLKLVLCGSYIAQMERLLKGPLRGRLTPLLVEPLGFAEAQSFIGASAAALERIERYAVSGGMSLYLDELARGGALAERIRTRVLDPRGPLFNDPREVLEEELRTPGVYYSILEELSTGKKSLGDLATALGRKTTDLQGYLDTLRDMRVVGRSAPVTALDEERNHRYALADDYMRFWFRFVFPFQEELKTGLSPAVLYRDEVPPVLADHISPTFEALCREWVVRTGRATRVGTWWGNALNEHRRSGSRQSEEIDVVGLRRSSVVVVGECKWQNSQLGLDVLEELETFKIPALRQAKARLAKDLSIVLFSKSGFGSRLVRAAEERDDPFARRRRSARGRSERKLTAGRTRMAATAPRDPRTRFYTRPGVHTPWFHAARLYSWTSPPRRSRRSTPAIGECQAHDTEPPCRRIGWREVQSALRPVAVVGPEDRPMGRCVPRSG